MRTYYPVTPEEIADGARRQTRGESCTIPVRELYRDNLGREFPMMAWGSPLAYKVIAHEGRLFAVFVHSDSSEWVLCTD